MNNKLNVLITIVVYIAILIALVLTWYWVYYKADCDVLRSLNTAIPWRCVS